MPAQTRSGERRAADDTAISLLQLARVPPSRIHKEAFTVSRMSSRMSWTRLIFTTVLLAGVLSAAVAPAADAAPAHAAAVHAQPMCAATLYPHAASNFIADYPGEMAQYQITLNWSCGNPFYDAITIQEDESMPPGGDAYWTYHYSCKFCSQSGTTFWINFIAPSYTGEWNYVYLSYSLRDSANNLLATANTTTGIYCC